MSCNIDILSFTATLKSYCRVNSRRFKNFPLLMAKKTHHVDKEFNQSELLGFIGENLKLTLDAEQFEQRVDKAQRLIQICEQIELDTEAKQAAFLCVFSPFNSAQTIQIREAMGEAVSEMIAGVAQMENISAFSITHQQSSKQGAVSDENLRKMLIAMVNDVRVVLIKLVDQVDVLRNIKNEADEVKKATAQITLDVYARLANRLGVWYLKWEMEDYALRYLEPSDYHQIAQELSEKRVDRERYIEQFINQIDQSLATANLSAKIYGRPKHIYSIWRKMRLKGLSFANILDIRAVRVLVDNIDQCYTALGLVHTQWSYLPGEFDDYIATPKPNGYQSIHTAVIGPNEKVVEVQIRTHSMHEENELGVAAHWRYKENSSRDQSIDNKIQWLRQLLEWKDDLTENESLSTQFEAETGESRVYVFTPKGRVIDLPEGSTAIDFAYAVHTEIGHRTRGTRINQTMRPLDTPLKTGDQVEIITVKSGGPSRDWVAVAGYIKTNRARARITHWFKTADKDQHLALGREKLERELSRKHLSDLSYDKIASAQPYDSVDEMMIALGIGEVKLTRLLSPFITEKPAASASSPVSNRAHKPSSGENQFMVQGVGKLKTQIANCCQPMPGEEIIGYITRGRGITIHQSQCSNIKNLKEDDLNRLIDVSWGQTSDAQYVMSLSVLAYNRQNLLHDVTEALKNEHVQILKAVLDIQEDESVVLIHLDIQLRGQQRIQPLLSKVKNIPNIIEVKRIFSKN